MLNRNQILSIVGASAMLVGCVASEEAAPEEQQRIVAPAVVTPQAETLRYQAVAREWTKSGLADESKVDDLVLRFDGATGNRQLSVQLGDASVKRHKLNSNGVSVERADGPAGELMRALPISGSQVEIGKSYESPAPSLEQLRANVAKGALTMVTHTTYTPTHIVKVGTETVVRLQTRSVLRLYADPDSPRTRVSGAYFDVRLASVGIADLVHIDKRGWRVARLTRSSIADNSARNIDSLGDARLVPHHRFRTCLDNASRAVEDALVTASLPHVPELGNCN